MFPWLAPCTPWNGGMLAHCDYVTLDEAARFASGQAGVEITTTDFLRAAGRGQIQMLAICDRVVTWEPCHATSVPTTTDGKRLFRLPIEACKALSQTGSANWRTIESYEHVKTLGDVLCRFTCWQLPDTEPDLKTTSYECRLTGYEVHSLSDAFVGELQPTPAQTAATPAPVGTGSASDGLKPDKAGSDDKKPWLVADPTDPKAPHHWYTPARYFARQLVLSDSTLLIKKLVLADKVSMSLTNAGIYKRGGKKPYDATTVLKAFSNVALG